MICAVCSDCRDRIRREDQTLEQDNRVQGSFEGKGNIIKLIFLPQLVSVSNKSGAG